MIRECTNIERVKTLFHRIGYSDVYVEPFVKEVPKNSVFKLVPDFHLDDTYILRIRDKGCVIETRMQKDIFKKCFKILK